MHFQMNKNWEELSLAAMYVPKEMQTKKKYTYIIQAEEK